jgi:glycerol-3-phosphate dehydrogenase subunit C
MTTTYDPFHPKYFDEADLRQEMVRVYDLCHGCRLCFKFCSAFPSLFDAVDRHDDQDAAKLTVAEQDRVVDECFNCKLCYVNCPYIPGQHEWALDFPRLMLRAEQVLHRNRKRPLRTRVTDQALGRMDAVGRLNSRLAPLVNKIVATPGSTGRKLVEKVSGISRERVLPPSARQRFSTWFRRWRRAGGLADAGDGAGPGAGRSHAVLFPTCLVEYSETRVGKDLVRVLERNDISCELPEGQVCCGAPWLHSGDVDSFRRQARGNVKVLADAVRAAQERGEPDVAVVVPQPTCGYVLKFDYRDYLAGEGGQVAADAEVVASHTRDAAEHLVRVHKGEGPGLDTAFKGDVPETVTYHAPCHLRAQNVGLRSRDLIKLTGAKVKVVAECSGIDGTWGLRAENLELSRKVGRKLAGALERAGGDVVAGDCQLANGGIFDETGRQAVHPISLVARAYGIDDDD